MNEPLKSFNYDKLDVYYILLVMEELKERVGDSAEDILIDSSFLHILHNDPRYVHHHKPFHWAKYIVEEYDSKK